jgi:predicted Fe-Mo cluster-binding NifX family protein
MKVVVTSSGAGLDAPASPVFGRCRSYVFVDTGSMEAETVENPAMNAAGGAGIQAAQFVVEQGAQAVITGNVGPNAYNVFLAAEVPVYLLEDGTVREAVEAFKKNRLPEAGGATGPAHAGMGRGMGQGGGRAGRRQSVPVSRPGEAEAPAAASREQEIAELSEMAADLRKQLAEVMDRLDQLEEA